MSGETITQREGYGEGLTALLSEVSGDFRQVGGSSNTHLHTSQNEPLETGGVDSVVWNLGVTWGFGLPFDELMASLSAGKMQAQEKHHDVSIVFNGKTFAISGGGKGTGGGRGVYYSYLIRHEGLTFKITKGASADEQKNGANVMAECGSLYLMVHGFDSAWAHVQEIVEGLGGRIFWHKFSRLDLCADLVGIECAHFVESVWEGRYVSKAMKKAYHEDGRRRTGVTIGTKDVILRIYDKLHEVTIARPDKEKELVLHRKRWGAPPEHALRVEFQLRRPALKELGINTMGDFWAKGGSLAKYLTADWFRILDEVPDAKNNHQTRTATAPEWQAVQKAFEEWLRKPRKEVQRQKRGFCKDPIRLVKQASGCMMGAVIDLCQEMHMNREEFRDHVHEVLDWGVDQMSDAEFREKYTSKTAKRLVPWSGAVLSQEPKARDSVPWVGQAADVGVLKRWKGAQSHG